MRTLAKARLAFALAVVAVPAGSPSAALAQAGSPKGAIETPQARLDTLDRQRRDGLGELERIAAGIALSEEKRTALARDIAALEKDQATLRAFLVRSARTQKKLTGDVRRSEARLAGLAAREETIGASLDARRDVLAGVLAALQRMGRNPPPALLVSPDDALASVRSAILLGAVVPELRGQTDRLVADLRELRQVRASFADERTRLRATLEERAREEERLTLLLAEKRKLTEENQARLAQEARVSERLAARAGTLEELIASLGAQIESVRKAAEDARKADEEVRRRASASAPDAGRIAPADLFSRLKGRLELPVAGTVRAGFGEDGETGRPLNGMTVAARPGAFVSAPADGWVVYAGPFRFYGQLLILNVGDGHHLVLAGMADLDVSIGQFVVAGEPVGRMAAAKVVSATALALASAEPTLYIEIRKGGKPVDPGSWWTGSSAWRTRNDS